MKISTRKVNYFICMTCIMVLAVFYAQITIAYSSKVRYVFLLVMIVSGMLSSGSDYRVIIKRKVSAFYIFWLVFSFFVVTGIRNNEQGSIRIFLCIILSMFLKNSISWIDICRKLVLFFTGINVFFTYFFLFFPSLYSKMIDFYDFVPPGTSHGTAGYRAGITNHYSQNGIYIAICFICLTALVYANKVAEKKGKIVKINILFIIITLVALLLTGKRGVLIWSLLAAGLAFLIVSRRKIEGIARIFLVALIGLGLMSILSENFVEIGYVFERFATLGDDSSSLERIAMWKLAIRKFTETPIFGAGFWKYREFYYEELAYIFHRNVERYQHLDAHNVYLQVLCETGGVGFVLYVLAAVCTLLKTIRLVKTNRNSKDETVSFALFFSCAVQIFYLTYSFSGNCLYDIVFYFYALAVAIIVTLEFNVREQKELGI